MNKKVNIVLIVMAIILTIFILIFTIKNILPPGSIIYKTLCIAWIVDISVILIINFKILVLKIIIFFKRYLLLVLLEIALIVTSIIVYKTNKAIILKEGAEHTGVYKTTLLKEGDNYLFETTNLDVGKQIKESIKILEITENNILIEYKNKKEQYDYMWSDFRFLNAEHGICGCYISFEKAGKKELSNILSTIMLMNLIGICFIKIKKED